MDVSTVGQQRLMIMKKLLFIFLAATCFISCSDYYREENRVEWAYYAIDSTECVVEGVFDIIPHPYFSYYNPGPRNDARAIQTSYATYYYLWQDYDWHVDLYEHVDTIANMPIAYGSTVRAYGIVRNITNGAGISFQDIIIDSIEIPTPVHRYIDTVENIVIQGEYRPMTLWLSDSVCNTNPCLYLPSPSADYPYHPEEIYYINPDVNFRTASKVYSVVYLCGEQVQQGEWVEVYGDLITGIDTKDKPYWWVNMDSIKIIPIPEPYK